MLNLKYWKSPAPVLTNSNELDRVTVTVTFAPFWVTSTVPEGEEVSHSSASADPTIRPTVTSAKMSSTALPTLGMVNPPLGAKPGYTYRSLACSLSVDGIADASSV